MLRGIPQATLQWMQGRKVASSSLMMCICSLVLMQMEIKEEIDEKIEAVVRDLEDVFVLLTLLPPKRSHDHQIQLLPNTLPMIVRPFRHPPVRKDAIEQMQAVISSPVLALPDFNKEFIVETNACGTGIGYDYEFDYKKGCDNSADDALSRVDNQAELASLVVVTITRKYTWSNEQLRGKGKLVVGNVAKLRKEIFEHFHVEPVGGHSRMQVTMKNLAAVVYWKKMRRMIKTIALPSSQANSDVFAVVDRLSKYAHFMALKHPFTGTQVAQVFMKNVYKLHGLSERIVTGESMVDIVDRSLLLREQVIDMLKFHLKGAQDKMKNQADKHRTDRSYEVRDWVYLKLQPYRKVRQNPYHKLSPKYYGPFLVCAKVGQVAYKLQLPSDSLIHPVFHVSQLEKCKGPVLERGILPQAENDGLLSVQLMAILVHLSNYDADGATWKVYDEVMQRFLSFLS
uniref:Protein NYNRIN-like n=1 Tax=Tanacetum cinerariifolium TaxID=118510 RepID=A0A6L2KQ27_TANCI|nr:protein NYNRIN-like [Tanacetum cinerariifolium]